MNLKSCYIENFGVFHQITLSFTTGFNIIKEENGWGKTTLAAFLKAMFYGLEYKKRSKDLYERTRYLPWQGGNYGGYLIFEHQGKEYKLLRAFGKKSVEDSFSLYDNLTNLPSEDFSEHIGEELFGIDCDSFERSIFITQDAKPPALSDSLSAKLGNLIDNTDDINNFETAFQTLDNLAASIQAKRGTGGRLGEIQNHLQSLKSQIDDCEESKQQVLLLQQKINSCRLQKQEVDSQRTNLQNELKKRDLLTKKREYEQLQSQRDKTQHRIKQIQAIFGNSMPSQDVLTKQLEDARQLDFLNKKLLSASITEEQRQEFENLSDLFSKGIPSQTELDSCEKKLHHCQEKQLHVVQSEPSAKEYEEYHALQKAYQGKVPTTKEIDSHLEDYTQSIHLKEQIEELQVKAKALHSQANLIVQNKMYIRFLMFLLSAVLLLASVMRDSLPRFFASLIFCSAFLLILIFVWMVRSHRFKQAFPKEELLQLEQQITDRTQEQKQFTDKYQNFLSELGFETDIGNIPRIFSDLKMDAARFWDLEAQWNTFHLLQKEYQATTAAIEMEWNAFLSPYRQKYPDLSAQNLLGLLRDKRLRFQTLQQQIHDYDDIIQEKELLVKKLNQFLHTCQIPSAAMEHGIEIELQNTHMVSQDSIMAALEYLWEAYRDFLSLQKELEQLSQNLLQFEQEHDIKAFLQLPNNSQTIEEIQDLLHQYDQEAERLTALTAEYQRNCDIESLKADRQQDLESEYDNLLEQKNQLQEKYHLFIKTRNLLQASKERLSNGYLHDTRKAFEHYINLLDDKQTIITLDTELHTSIEQSGKIWNGSYLSSGYKDLVHLCIRLALAEGMYHGKPPFLLLDDPFVNLDSIKLDRAINFLNKLAEQTQILYFTCHQSRCPK